MNNIKIDKKLEEIAEQIEELRKISLDLGFEDGGFNEEDIIDTGDDADNSSM